MVPCIFGVLTVLNKQQAVVRSSGSTNEGISWGRSAVEMGLARMSAMGMDRKTSGSGSDAAVALVTLQQANVSSSGNITAIPVSDGKNATKPAKKFGF